MSDPAQSDPAQSDPAQPDPAQSYVAQPYPDEQRDAVYRVIAERRDVRQGFRPDPVPADVLGRVLAAAHRRRRWASPSRGTSS